MDKTAIINSISKIIVILQDLKVNKELQYYDYNIVCQIIKVLSAIQAKFLIERESQQNQSDQQTISCN